MAKPTQITSDAPVLDTRRPPAKEAGVRQFSGMGAWLDERVGLGKIAKGGLRKVFPDHWSFLLGEIALYSFLVLLITGVFLTIWFKPSMAEIEYNGSYQLMRGLPMSEAFASALALSFDVRGGLLVRQIHHWAAILFIAAMTAHMLRIFFTGAFRKPRELNWLIGVGLMSLSLIAKCTTAPRLKASSGSARPVLALRGGRSSRYCAIAASTLCVKSVSSSTVATGRPLMKNARSMRSAVSSE